ncbi:ABC transporter permease [Metabacillus fastidiosus]|uniref:ABC transporter permease n=1 Tax=Metabacillus fastidiosus TaxID=1458 RepID=UPI002E1A66C3|nr:ABC transporter permease [Metabacillus fastidiosus]
MTLFNVVAKNLKHNFKHYFLYVASMTFSILIYFIFVSLQHNEQITKLIDRGDKVGPALFASSFILLLFVSVFIWYSNSFFIKKRKQEIGLYSLLGVRKKAIGKMIFYENFLLSTIALIVGIVIGELFSMLFSMILVKLMGFSFLVQFSLNINAVIQTFIIFLIITFFTSLQGYYIMYRFQLIDLFQARNKGQSIVKPSVIITLLSIVFISISYWMLWNAADSKDWSDHFGRNLLITLGMMVVGSYFLFHSLSGFFVQLLQNNKTIYYKWKNLLTFTQLKSRLKSNAVMLTTISVLNAVTLIAFGFAYTLYYNTLGTMEEFIPYSYQYEIASKEMDEQITNTIRNNKQHEIIFDDTFDYIMAKGNADSLEEIPGGYSYYDNQFAVMSETAYNKLAKQLKREQISSLKENETIIVNKNFIGSQDENENNGKPISLPITNKEIHLVVANSKTESLFNNDTVHPATLIVSNTIYEKLKNEYSIITSHIFKIENEKDSAPLTLKLWEIIESHVYPADDRLLNLYSFSDSYGEAQSVYGLLIFISSFLGLVFLSATGSIIYFKILTEAEEDRKRYTTLKKVGMNRREIKRVIAKQYMIFFLLPLIVGIAHSCIMLSSLSKIMDINFITPVVISTIIYSILYGCYYIMTLITSNRLVNA